MVLDILFTVPQTPVVTVRVILGYISNILDRLMQSNKLYMYVLLVGDSHTDYTSQLYVYSTLVPHSAAEFCGPTLSPPS